MAGLGMTQLPLFEPPPAPSGVLWVMAGGRRVGLVVVHGRVKAAHPPFLGRWAVRKSLAWVQGRHPDAVWQAGVATFHYLLRADARPVRRWQHPGRHISKETDLLLGLVQGRWWVAETGRQGVGFIYPTAAGALAEVRVRLDPPDGWVRVPAAFDRTGWPQPEVDVPELAELDVVWPLTGRGR